MVTGLGKTTSLEINFMGVDGNHSSMEIEGIASAQTGNPVSVKATLLTREKQPLLGKKVDLIILYTLLLCV